jgi:ribA/ribD-fused uncharacterized protein
MEKIIIGDVAWMRSDYRQDITIGKITYPTLEHAYQAAKTKDRDIKQEIASTDNVRDARKIGRHLQQSDTFDREAVMEALQRQKYASELGEMLAKTGSVPIVMEAYDEFWGTGRDGEGQNILGELLQTIRSDLQIIYDVELDDDDDDDCGDCDNCHCNEAVPLLRDAIINAPDEALAVACQKLLDGAKAVVSLLDANDYNAPYISQKTGAPLSKIEDAIQKVRSFQETLTDLETILETPKTDESTVDDDESDEDDDEDDRID